jgi:TatA/E family protein of Tat protein translocase
VFGVSLPELIVVFVVVLLVFGPDKLPEIARNFGKWTGDLRRTSDTLRREFYHTVYNPVDSARRELSAARTELLSDRAPQGKPSSETTEARGETAPESKKNESP